MKKKNDLVDKAEIVDDPTSRYKELQKVNENMNILVDIEQRYKSIVESIEATLSKLVWNDREITKVATIVCVKQQFDKCILEFYGFSKIDANIKEKLYYVILNLSIVVYGYCHKMRNSRFSIHCTKYLIWIITLIENNIVLSNVKYSKWRVKLYSELAFAYEDYNAYKSAYKVIIQAISKINELKAIEELQGPLPSYLTAILVDDLRILKCFEFKFGILVRFFFNLVK